MKSFFKKYPILTVIGSILALGFIGYITLVLIVLRPVNMLNGRMNSYDKSWKEVKENINLVNIGTSVDSLNLVLGRPDKMINSGDTITIYSYEQYGTVAPHWVYDIHVKKGRVVKLESYNW